MTSFLDALLAPISRLLVARGLLFPEIAERLKRHYVTAAEQRAQTRVTDSRISVMTGLQRRDVIRLRALPQDPASRPPNHLARLVALWQNDPAYHGAPLPRRGAAASFESLALTIRRDVHPRSLLDELLASGTVSLTPDDLVRLEQTSYQPLAGSEPQLDYFAANAGDFLTAATSNLLNAPAPFFERAAHYNQLSQSAVAELEQHFRAAQMQLLRDLSAKAAALQASSPGTERFRAGGYFYHEDET